MSDLGLYHQLQNARETINKLNCELADMTKRIVKLEKELAKAKAKAKANSYQPKKPVHPYT